MKKFQFLDSARGIAVLLVLLVHSGAVCELFGTKNAVATFGQRGVQLFYEVSAFSLLYSVGARHEASWRAFFIRRFFRVAPLFYLSMLANWVATVGIGKGAPLSAGAYLSGVLFLFGFHPETINAVAPAGWSVAVETTFYALFPVLAYVIRDLRRATAAACVTTLACFFLCYHAHAVAFHRLPSEYVEFLWFPAELPVFCMGFVAYYGWRDLVPSDRSVLRTFCLPDQPPAKAAMSGLLMCASLGILSLSFPSSNYSLYIDSFALLLFLLALAVWPWRLFVNPLTAWIGRLSYSIYLVHPYLRSAVSSTLEWLSLHHSIPVYGSYLGLLLTLALFLGGSLLVAAVTYSFVEKPGIRLGKWLIQRCRLSAPRAPAHGSQF
jgi:peptidoglycan/LPS O-acetylase OafA/YrhL